MSVAGLKPWRPGRNAKARRREGAKARRREGGSLYSSVEWAIRPPVRAIVNAVKMGLANAHCAFATHGAILRRVA